MSVKHIALTTLLGGVLATGAIGYISLCSDIPEKHVELRKGYSGEISYTSGPAWTWTGPGTRTVEWDGRRVVDLPLDTGSKQSAFYETSNGYLSIDGIVYYEVEKSKESRDKWFVKITNPEIQFPLEVEGIARSTIKGYTNDEILDEKLAISHNKLPWYRQLALNLKQNGANDEYGIDKDKYSVWPGNISPLPKSALADLERQRKIILNESRNTAQSFEEKAMAIKADVDNEYSLFLNTLSPSMIEYLKAVDVTSAVLEVSKGDGQKSTNVKYFIK